MKILFGILALISLINALVWAYRGEWVWAVLNLLGAWGWTMWRVK